LTIAVYNMRIRQKYRPDRRTDGEDNSRQPLPPAIHGFIREVSLRGYTGADVQCFGLIGVLICRIIRIRYKGDAIMKKTLLILLAMVFVCTLSFAGAWAQDKKPEAKKEAAATMDAKEKAIFSKKVGLFYQLVAYGEAQKDPLVLLNAVKVLDDLPFKGIAKPGQDEKTGARYDRTILLNEAKEFAAGDNELLAVIAKVEEPPEKTAVRGHHGYHGYYDRPHHRRHYECVWFEVCRHGRCDWVCR
jgi:hypothetical protein